MAKLSPTSAFFILVGQPYSIFEDKTPLTCEAEKKTPLHRSPKQENSYLYLLSSGFCEFSKALKSCILAGNAGQVTVLPPTRWWRAATAFHGGGLFKSNIHQASYSSFTKLLPLFCNPNNNKCKYPKEISHDFVFQCLRVWHTNTPPLFLHHGNVQQK